MDSDKNQNMKPLELFLCVDIFRTELSFRDISYCSALYGELGNNVGFKTVFSVEFKNFFVMMSDFVVKYAYQYIRIVHGGRFKRKRKNEIRDLMTTSLVKAAALTFGQMLGRRL